MHLRLRTLNPSRTAAAFVLALAVGCAHTQSTPQTLTGLAPVFTASAETPSTQDHGGLKISCAPVPYAMVQKADVQVTQANQFARARQTVKPVLVPDPERLALQITINNDMDHLFRSQGAVVQFQIAGKLVAGNANDYAELANAIVPPRNQTQVTIFGPPLATLPSNTTIAVMLFDVVTATDAAGNPSKRENFTWYFTYTTQTTEQEAKPMSKRSSVNTAPQPAPGQRAF